MSEPILSPAEVAEIEKIYHRNTTPWRCRMGLHKWAGWSYMFSIQYGAQSRTGGRSSAPGLLDVQLRLCPACMKVQGRTVKALGREPVAWEGEGEDD